MNIWHKAWEEFPNESCEVVVAMVDTEDETEIYCIQNVQFSSKYKAFNCMDESDKYIADKYKMKDTNFYWCYFEDLAKQILGEKNV